MSLTIKPTTIVKSATVKSFKKIKVVAKDINAFVFPLSKFKESSKLLKDFLASHQLKEISSDKAGSYSFQTPKGNLTVISVPEEVLELATHEGMLDESNYTYCRDHVGAIISKADLKEKTTVNISFYELEYDEVLGSALGMDMGYYHFSKKRTKPVVNVFYNGALNDKGVKEALKAASQISGGVNISRHLVDTPPNLKRPIDYSNAVVELFKGMANVKLTVWDDKKLKKENMGLISAVGQASEQGPRMVHISYRPKKSNLDQPLAFVGKGITFDSGGLNIKPGGSMRLMKKDMGGSASIVGLAYWAATSKVETPCDFYLALAENAIDANSFRPSDILQARNGMTVEIDNTDAEGRLVMADVLSYAAEKKGKDKPLYLIDVATLTGAIKVGLGSELGGLFSDDDELAFLLQSCAQVSGDYLWRMPLLKSQRKKLNTPFADIVNSAGGFGGAVRAAMFLKDFKGDIPWAHLDIYQWQDGTGPYAHSGGAGQSVQCLAQFVSQF
ncbi:MAG: leucyl aminopeptidase family protein [Oligoflexia bacterium]|nr:leucyl aminopeptidase family protein [Oligoflexia bacterium]